MLNPKMVWSTGAFPMNCKQNLIALELNRHSMRMVNNDSLTMSNLQLVAFLHSIVEATLNEQVSNLEEATEISH